MPNRKKAEAVILSIVSELDTTGYNTAKYKEIFSGMSDKDFDTYMKKMRDKEATVVFFAPSDKHIPLTTESLLAVADKHNISFFEHLTVIPEDKTKPSYKTPIKYLVLDLPYKRQSQNLVKKISIPEHNKTIDSLTFQPTGASKGARISYPELQLLLGMGLEKSLDELMRFRGGDKNGFGAYNGMILRYGTANLDSLNNYSSGVESTKTLKIYFLGMHINSTLK